MLRARLPRLVATLVVALVLGLVAAPGGVGAPPAQAVPPPDTVAELVQRLRQDPVQVNTMMGLGDAGAVHSALSSYAEQVPAPVYVVLDLLPQELESPERDHRAGEELIELLSAELGEGLYVVSLGASAESIIGYRSVSAVGVDRQLRNDFGTGSSYYYDVTNYAGEEPLRVYLGLRAVVEGGDAVESLSLADLRTDVPWAFPGSFRTHQESLALRLGATVVVPATLLALVVGAMGRLRRERRRGDRSLRPARPLRSVALVVGVVPVSAALTFAVLTPQVAPLPRPGEQESAAATAFADGGPVYLSPDLEGWLDPQQLQQITEAAEAAPVPTRVALWYPTQDTDALELTARALGDPAVYLSASPDEVDGFAHGLSGDTFWPGPRWEQQADPALFTTTVLELLAEAAGEGDRPPAPEGYSPVLGADPGSTLGIAGAVSVLTVAAGLALGWVLPLPLLARRRRSGPDVAEPSEPLDGPATPTPAPERATRSPSPEPLRAPPGGPVEPVAAAPATAPLVPRPAEPLDPGEVEGWTRSARFELGNLERTLRFLGPGAAASPAAETARRHATAAAGLLAAGTGPADQLGAWVLTRRGSAAAAAATALQPFVATPSCWFHPEHPAGSEQRGFEGRTVPTCRGCAAELDQGREPAMLDLPGPDGAPVHFHRSGAEPWAGTGFGATEPDLPARLDHPG